MEFYASLKMIAVPLLGLASLLVTPAHARADDRDDAPKRFISLSGLGAIKTTPDKADISTGVTSVAPTAKEALAKNTAAMSKVIDALKAQGLDPKDIQTTNFSVQPQYEERKEARLPAIIGYQVSNSVRIGVRDISRLGDILDEVVTLGANDVGSIEFGVAAPETTKVEARKLAVANAIANAKVYADAAGVKLGKVLTITEEEGGFGGRFAPAPMEMAAKAVPIEAGTTTVEARVRVTFELE